MATIYPYRVTVSCEGAQYPYVDTPCRTRKEARSLASRTEAKARNMGARIVVRVFNGEDYLRDWRAWDEEGNDPGTPDLAYPRQGSRRASAQETARTADRPRRAHGARRPMIARLLSDWAYDLIACALGAPTEAIMRSFLRGAL